MAKKKTVLDFIRIKENRERFCYLVLYDFTFAMLAEQAGVDMILIGDSMGNVIYGYDGTVPVTLEQIIGHAGAVRRGHHRCAGVREGTARPLSARVRRRRRDPDRCQPRSPSTGRN